MPVHPQAQEFIDQSADMPTVSDMAIEDARAMMDGFNALAGEPEGVHSVDDREVPGVAGPIPIRVYRSSGEPNLPVTVYYHAGGFVMGSLDSHDSLCRQLTNRSEGIVVAVHYRRAPEHKFPAPVEDAFAVLQWVGEHAAEIGGDANRLAVAGDSVGGGLSTIAAIMARDAGGPALRLHVMVYPDVDWFFDSESWTTMGTDYFVTTENGKWFRENYFNNDDEWGDWRGSPLRHPDLSGLAPALLLYPEYSCARSDMEAYGKRLQEAGVPTTVSMYEGMLMGWWSMSSIFDAGREAVDEVGTALRKAFAE